MQRARVFRLSAWRLGLFVLAAYALVLQGMLGTASPRAMPADAATLLCSDGLIGHDGSPLPTHGHPNCNCTIHHGGAPDPATPASVAAAPAWPAFRPVAARTAWTAPLAQPQTQRRFQPRAPPVANV